MAPRAARFPWLPLLLGILLAGAGGAAFVTSVRVPALTARLVDGNRPVNSGATERLDATANNSPALVVNPTTPANLVVANRIDSPGFSCGLHVSLDGGATWGETALPLPGSTPSACFSPDAAFAADGTLFVAFTTFGHVEGHGNVPDALWLATSGDGGRTLSPPRQVSGPLAFQVRVTADHSRPGRVYLSWVQAAGTAAWGFSTAGNPIVVARTDDGGETWGEPVRVNPVERQRVVAPSTVVAGNGELHVAYLDVGDDRLDYHGAHEGRAGEPYPGSWSLLVATSHDGGTTWQQSVVEDRLVPTERFLVLYPPHPSLASDARRGRLYVGYHDGRLGDADVWVWRSEDAARTWARARRVNDTAPGDGQAQYLPALAVSPDARLDLVYYDRRSDPHGAMTQVSFQSSVDGGTTFAPRLVLSDRPFDSRIGVGSERGMADLGHRLGLVATERGSLAVWSDTRAGTSLTGKQDLASAVVRVSRPSPLLLGSLRYGGVLVGVLGLVVVAGPLISRASARRRPVGGAGAQT